MYLQGILNFSLFSCNSERLYSSGLEHFTCNFFVVAFKSSNLSVAYRHSRLSVNIYSIFWYISVYIGLRNKEWQGVFFASLSLPKSQLWGSTFFIPLVPTLKRRCNSKSLINPCQIFLFVNLSHRFITKPTKIGQKCKKVSNSNKNLFIYQRINKVSLFTLKGSKS